MTSQDIRNQFDTKVDKTTFKEMLDLRVRVSDFERWVVEVKQLKSFCHFELIAMIEKLQDELKLE